MLVNGKCGFELTKEQWDKFNEWKATLLTIPGAHYHFTFTPTLYPNQYLVKVSKDSVSDVLDLTEIKRDD